MIEPMLICDSCDRLILGGAHDREEVERQLAEEGGRTFATDRHACPECVRAGRVHGEVVSDVA